MKFYLLTGNHTLTLIDKFELHDSERFSIELNQTIPLAAFSVVDENLNVYACQLNRTTLVGSIVARVMLSQLRLDSILKAMNSLQEN
jgi:hypothetical protein